MARAYGAVLSILAVTLIAIRGIAYSGTGREVLMQALSAMPTFFLVGYVLGYLAETVLRQSAEKRFRQVVDNFLATLDERSKKA